MNRSALTVALLAALALAVTAVLFVHGSAGTSIDPAKPPAPITGKLSQQVVALESTFKELQAKWKAVEPKLKSPEKDTFRQLSDLNNGFKQLSFKAEAAKGESQAEIDALPHFRTAISESAKVPEVYMFATINPKVVTPQRYEEAKAAGNKANEEWKAWLAATESLSR